MFSRSSSFSLPSFVPPRLFLPRTRPRHFFFLLHLRLLSRLLPPSSSFSSSSSLASLDQTRCAQPRKYPTSPETYLSSRSVSDTTPGSSPYQTPTRARFCARLCFRGTFSGRFPFAFERFPATFLFSKLLSKKEKKRILVRFCARCNFHHHHHHHHHHRHQKHPSSMMGVSFSRRVHPVVAPSRLRDRLSSSSSHHHQYHRNVQTSLTSSPRQTKRMHP